MSEISTPPTPGPDAPKNGNGGSGGSLDLSGLWSHVVQLPRIAGIAALATYALGLLVVNMYLFQIGVTDFSILRTRYILTGILVIVAPSLLLLGVLMTIVVVEGVVASGAQGARRSSRRLDRVKSIVVFGIMPILSIFLALGGLLFGSGITYRSSFVALATDQSGMVFLLFITLLPQLIAVAAVNAGWRRNAHDWKWTDLQRFALSVAGVIIVVGYLLLYVDLFASTFFPIIPEQFGGGRPKQVQIVLSEDSNALGSTLGYDNTEDRPTILDVELLWETEQMYVVRDRSQQADRIIQIDRDEVSAIVLDRSTTPAPTAPATPVATPVPGGITVAVTPV